MLMRKNVNNDVSKDSPIDGCGVPAENFKIEFYKDEHRFWDSWTFCFVEVTKSSLIPVKLNVVL